MSDAMLPARLYLLLGANLGPKEQTLEEARQQIGEQIGPIDQVSSLYETAAWGLTDQPTYLNQVVVVSTSLTPPAVLTRTQAIEQRLGRVRAEKWGARLIDIDLLFYNDQICHDARLTLPHPLLHERRFTLAPLAEVAPELVHPVLNLPIRVLLDRCSDTSPVIKLS